jgi:hypothetical protein
MIARLLRFLLPVLLCPLLGAMAIRGYALKLGGETADILGWVLGALLGLGYAVLLLVMASSSPRSGRPRIADLLLIALCSLALADLIGQLQGVADAWLFHSVALTYLLSLWVAGRTWLRTR